MLNCLLAPYINQLGMTFYFVLFSKSSKRLFQRTTQGFYRLADLTLYAVDRLCCVQIK